MNDSSQQPTGEEMKAEEINGTPSRFQTLLSRMPLITAAAVVLVFAGLAFLALSLSSGSERPLYPALATPTQINGTMEFEPVEIGFAELNADPEALLGRRLQVSGIYTPVEQPDCLDYTGPVIRWSLVAEDLQLNAVGYETLLRLVEPGADMTVIGIWTAYRGPVGCGKEPEDATVWYLQVERIIAPNPLFGASSPMMTVIPGEALPTLPPLEALTPVPPDLSPTPTISGTITVTVTVQPTILPSITTPTLEPTGLPVTPLATAGSPVATVGTPDTGATPAGTPTAGPSPTPTVTGGAQGTTTPGIPTTTPSGTGYPSQSTPTATTTGGYP